MNPAWSELNDDRSDRVPACRSGGVRIDGGMRRHLVARRIHISFAGTTEDCAEAMVRLKDWRTS